MKHECIKILVYSAIQDRYCKEIENGISRLARESQVLFHTTTESFFDDLTRQPSYCVIALIVIRNFREIQSILDHKDKLVDRQLILVYPHPSSGSGLDSTPTAMLKASLKLYPRYTSYKTDDVTDILAVIEKMITRIVENQFGVEKY